MQFVYLFPTPEGYWLVAREGETGVMFQDNARAMEYAQSVAITHRPSAVVELTAAGEQVRRLDYP